MSGNWKSVKLKDITSKIGSGATPRGGKNAYKKSGISLVRSLNVYNFKFEKKDLAYIDAEQAERLSNVVLEENDILLNITGASVARCTIVPNDILPARVNQHVSIIRVKKSIADPYFVLYAINSNYYKHRLLTLAQGGATREALTKEMIENFEIQLPPLPVQQKIASILSTYDYLIENNNRRITILEEMAQKFYREWFVKFRFPGYEKDKIVESELGLIPEGWEIYPANKLFEINIGKTPPRKQKEWFSKKLLDIKWVSIKDMGKAGVFILDTNEKITQKGIEKFNIKIVPKNTVILSFKLTVGKVAIVPEDMVTNEAIAHFNQNSQFKVPNSYTYAYLRNFKYQILGNTSSIGNALNSKIIKSMLFLYPEKTILEKFDILMTPLFRSIFTMEKRNQNLQEQRDLLLPKLILGKINIEKMENV